MQLRYTLDETDYLYALRVSGNEFRRAVGGNAGRTGLIFLFAMFLFMALLTAFAGLRDATYLGYPATHGVIAYVLLALAMFFAYRRYSATLARRATLRLAGPFPVDQTVTIDDDAFEIAAPHRSGRVEWGAVEWIRRDAAYVTMMIRPFTVFVIPVRAFDTPADADAFVAKIRGKLASSARKS